MKDILLVLISHLFKFYPARKYKYVLWYSKNSTSSRHHQYSHRCKQFYLSILVKRFLNSKYATLTLKSIKVVFETI